MGRRVDMVGGPYKETTRTKTGSIKSKVNRSTPTATVFHDNKKSEGLLPLFPSDWLVLRNVKVMVKKHFPVSETWSQVISAPFSFTSSSFLDREGEGEIERESISNRNLMYLLPSLFELGAILIF